MLLYRMQFSWLSGPGGAKLWLDARDQSGPKSQIDVVGVDNELALAIECKSQEKFGKRSQFQEELAKLAQTRERISRAVNGSQFPHGAKRQATLAFFTNNVDLTRNDRERPKEANVHLFDDKDLDYYEKLIAHLGSAAKYQFFADMLPGKTIPGLTIRVPAVRTTMGAFYCYSFPMSPEYLLKISYVSHRSKGKASDVEECEAISSSGALLRIALGRGQAERQNSRDYF